MAGIDLTTQEARLKLAEAVFNFPAEPHNRKHGPLGYVDYESYRDWLRDEFSYRCVFSLIREEWIGKGGAFDIDHLEPQASRPDLKCEYENLLYLTHRLNLKRGKRSLPDPCKIALGNCMRIHSDGTIEGLCITGEKIIRVLRLDSEDATAERNRWLNILRSVAMTDPSTFRKLMGFPSTLPKLHLKKPPGGNRRESGIQQCAYLLQDRGELPDAYL